MHRIASHRIAPGHLHFLPFSRLTAAAE